MRGPRSGLSDTTHYDLSLVIWIIDNEAEGRESEDRAAVRATLKRFPPIGFKGHSDRCAVLSFSAFGLVIND